MKFVGYGGQLLTPIRRCLYRCIQYPPECHIIYAINQLYNCFFVLFYIVYRCYHLSYISLIMISRYYSGSSLLFVLKHYLLVFGLLLLLYS